MHRLPGNQISLEHEQLIIHQSKGRHAIRIDTGVPGYQRHKGRADQVQRDAQMPAQRKAEHHTPVQRCHDERLEHDQQHIVAGKVIGDPMIASAAR